jgi:serine kinase of HPr protein (carbohydrate metabolism regulator)
LTDHSSELVHATAVAIDGRGVLISGPSGAGKSDLALRLIDRGAELVADDQVRARRVADDVLLDAPPTIAGRIEVRGVGIVTMPHRDDVPLALCVALGSEERLPAPRTRDLLGRAVREVAIDPRPASAPLKVELALRRPESAIA